MAIKFTKPQVNKWGTYTAEGSTDVEYLFQGRVLEIEQVYENRNCSDTLDYSDFRSVHVTYALVWLGPHNHAPSTRHRNGTRMMTRFKYDSYDSSTPRDLEYWEQFAWVDCTNTFVHCGSPETIPTVDADPSSGTDPLMWANYLAWKGYQKGLEEARAREAAQKEREEQEKAAKVAAKQAAKAAKDLSDKAAAEGMLATAPKKGTSLTVDGFTGVVFWGGVNKFRGKWKASIGIKDNRGDVRWVNVADIKNIP